jgi:hypothetical protein
VKEGHDGVKGEEGGVTRRLHASKQRRNRGKSRGLDV